MPCKPKGIMPNKVISKLRDIEHFVPMIRIVLTIFPWVWLSMTRRGKSSRPTNTIHTSILPCNG